MVSKSGSNQYNIFLVSLLAFTTFLHGFMITQPQSFLPIKLPLCQEKQKNQPSFCFAYKFYFVSRNDVLTDTLILYKKRMNLCVYLLEGRDLPVKDSYVKLRVGKFKSKTRVLKNKDNPFWNEEFVFRVDDLEDELVISLYKYDDHEPGFFNVYTGNLMGRVKIPLWSVAEEENQNLPPTWFSIKRTKNVKLLDKDCGKLLLALSLHGREQESYSSWERKSISLRDAYLSALLPKKTLDGKSLMKGIAGHLEKFFKNTEETSRNGNSSEPSTASDGDDSMEGPHSVSRFHELLELMQSTNGKREMPETLHGGILLDQTYLTSSNNLNVVLFAPNSNFGNKLAELQGTVDIHEGPWMCKSEEMLCLTRFVSFTKAATKLFKAAKATEQQTYVMADGKEFAVLVNVSTPDVPYGNTFKIELLYKIMPGAVLSSGEESAHLEVSWAVNFIQNTMMKGMIEGGVKQGLKESFDQFASLLSQKFKVVTALDMSNKDQMLATMDTEHQSNLEFAMHYFWNFTVVSTVFLFLYVAVHIFLCEPDKLQGLEIGGLDLPDSWGEFITCGILVIQLERVYNMLSHFVEARLQRGSDHGIKAQGDGWVLTVALIEGANLAPLNSTEICNPYVVFTCNGKTRTSSVKLQTLNPQWNEILEFDAVEDPPSVLVVEVFDFDGPFDHVSSLGHTEINFLKHTSTELADLWIPLDGKLAQSSQSKLHLRIFLDNNNGVETIIDYLAKMEKEVGKKLNLRSPHENSTFQKLFGLPPEEFLINDFSCSLKRKMPLQGRLFSSARIIAFYANLFGHKTKFFFLWEDIEDIRVLPPSFSTVGSPSLEIILHKGRGLDARHGAKILDDEGRLHFYFHSFVSFNIASRTIMALWKTRTLEQDQKNEIAGEQLDDNEKHFLEDTGSSLVVEDVKMLQVYSAELPVNVKSLMLVFDGGELEHRVMSKSGCLNYVTTTWEHATSDIQERHVSYKFNRRISIFGGEVTCTQQKSPTENEGGWVVNEIMTLRDVPFADHFRVYFKYQIKNSSFAHNSCKCDVCIGVKWLKSTKFEHKITKNIVEKFTNRSEEILQMVGREILLAGQF